MTLTLSRSARALAAVGALCAAAPACVSEDLSETSSEHTATAQAAILDNNGLDPNGWDLNGLHWNGLHTQGLNWNGLHTQGLRTLATGYVTSNVQAWLQGQTGALAVMQYLVACAVPSGTTVQATVNGAPYSWGGLFGLAPDWVDSTALSTTEQEWVSACLLAHVNLQGNHVLVSFRGAHPGLATTATERSSHNCREAAFMGNVFAGWETDPLPLTQCHEQGALAGTGRSCDPTQNNFYCAVDCYAACDKASDYFSSCNLTVNGTARTYTHVITTYLPTSSTNGCLGWGLDVTSHSASFQSYSGGGGQWNWSWGWNLGYSSCSASCGGYSGTCSCTPDCQSKGTCCSDYTSLCGTPPIWSGPTSGVNPCPSGYTAYTGSLSSTHTDDYWPSSSGYQPLADGGMHHGTLLGPSGSDFDLYVEQLSGGQWTEVAQSDRSVANESIHFFYGKKGGTYRWNVNRYAGSGSYTFCLKHP